MNFIKTCATLGFFGAMILPAVAGEPIDFTQHIVTLDGKDIPSTGDKDSPPLDLAIVAETGLLTEIPADPRAAPKTATDKRLRFDLALRIHDEKKLALTSEEVTLLKDSIASVFSPLVVGRAIQILDPVKPR